MCLVNTSEPAIELQQRCGPWPQGAYHLMAKRLQNTKYWIEGDIAGCGDKEEIPGGNDAGEFDKGLEGRGQRERYRKFLAKEQHKGRPGCADVQRRYFIAPPHRG